MSNSRRRGEPPDQKLIDLSNGLVENWCCVDCGMNTAPGCSTRAEVEEVFRNADDVDAAVPTQHIGPDSELYTVRDSIWKRAGMGRGVLCIGCLEKRIGRRLKPKDFVPEDALNFPELPCTDRLRDRRGY
jgi:hypothetical protein